MSIEKQKNIMIYMEIISGAPINSSLEAITQARYIANSTNDKIIVTLVGENLEEFAKTAINYGADEVICIEDKKIENEAIAKKLFKIKEEYKPRIIFLAATQNGKDIGALLASYSKIPALTDVVEVNLIENKEVFTLPMYSGNILKQVSVSNGNTAIVILRSGTCKKEKLETKDGNIQIKTFEDIVLKAKIIETVKEISENVNLEEAEVIVSGGRGMGTKENFELVKKLAETLGGVVGATRPVTEENWVPKSHQIGQSGKIVAPKLYIACGVSGATQHISGALGSEYIVAINKDEDASIFEVADLGIVGNAMDILPLFIEEVKKIKNC